MYLSHETSKALADRYRESTHAPIITREPASQKSTLDLVREMRAALGDPRAATWGESEEDILSDIAKMQHPPTETEWAQIQRRARAVMAEG